MDNENNLSKKMQLKEYQINTSNNFINFIKNGFEITNIMFEIGSYPKTNNVFLILSNESFVSKIEDEEGYILFTEDNKIYINYKEKNLYLNPIPVDVTDLFGSYEEFISSELYQNAVKYNDTNTKIDDYKKIINGINHCEEIELNGEEDYEYFKKYC